MSHRSLSDRLRVPTEFDHCPWIAWPSHHPPRLLPAHHQRQARAQGLLGRRQGEEA